MAFVKIGKLDEVPPGTAKKFRSPNIAIGRSKNLLL